MRGGLERCTSFSSTSQTSKGQFHKRVIFCSPTNFHNRITSKEERGLHRPHSTKLLSLPCAQHRSAQHGSRKYRENLLPGLAQTAQDTTRNLSAAVCSLPSAVSSLLMAGISELSFFLSPQTFLKKERHSPIRRSCQPANRLAKVQDQRATSFSCPSSLCRPLLESAEQLYRKHAAFPHRTSKDSLPCASCHPFHTSRSSGQMKIGR